MEKLTFLQGHILKKGFCIANIFTASKFMMHLQIFYEEYFFTGAKRKIRCAGTTINRV